MNPSQDATTDALIEEVRERRRQISTRFGNDLNRYFDELVRLEKRHPERLATPAPRPRHGNAVG
jgi:hypothetical protein